MHAKIQKWGNSQGIRLAKNLLADAQLGVGDEVDINVKDGIMIVKPAKRMRGRHSLKELVARIPEDHQTGEVDWGEPLGKEVGLPAQSLREIVAAKRLITGDTGLRLCRFFGLSN